MKSLQEKKLLARMARNMGQPDLVLEESIRKEELLNEKLFIKPKIEMPSVPILREEMLIIEADPTALVQEPAETNIVPEKPDLIQQAAQAISAPTFAKPAIPDLHQKELDGIRKTLAEMMQKISTMSWGGGGTGVVRFVDLDDHKAPKDIEHIQLNRMALPYTPPAGSLAWNLEEDCLDIYQNDGSVLQTGLENYIKVQNTGTTTLLNGELVTFGGVDGGYNPIAIKSVANSTFAPIYVIGVLTHDIPAGGSGRATTFGKVHNIDTTGTPVGETWQVGDLLWMHPTLPGKMTKFKPTPPEAIVSIAAVTKVDAIDGEILVRPVIDYRKFYGAFSDTGNTSHTAALINTPYMAHINTTDFSSGHTLGANNNIIAQNPGLYNYQFSLQVTSTNSSTKNIYVWPRKNKQDVPNSASIFTIGGNGGNIVPAWNFIIPMDAGDEFQLMWAVDDTSIQLKGATSTGFCPAIPTLILTVTQVA